MDNPSVANRFHLDHEFRGQVSIAGLPDHLALIPSGPNSPLDPDRFQKRQAWHDWSHKIRLHRLNILASTASDPLARRREIQKCAADPLYFQCLFAYIYEPRKGSGRGGFSPWIPFERQAQMTRWVQWVREQDDENADGVLSKCRDVGASWNMCLQIVHQWLFSIPYNGLAVSWKEEYVDSRKPRSLFWKIDRILDYIPHWMRPDMVDVQLFMENKGNNNTITGESTNSNAMRGDRGTEALLDEAAQIPGLMDIWMGIADSTEHRFGISTESLDQGTDWVDLRSGAAEYTPSVFTIDWWEHPLHDDDWYARQEKRYAADPAKFRREILRDPYVESQFVYPRMREKFPIPDLAYEPGNPLYVAIDPGFDDSCAIVVIQFNVRENRYEVLNGYTNRLKIAEFYGPLLSGKYEKADGTEMQGDWQYSPYEDEFIEWMHSIGSIHAKFIGDTYGNNRSGASADTWYSVWARDFDIRVNRDRLPTGQVAAHRMQARTMEGRRKALRWVTPNLVFADTIGARKVLDAVQNNQFDEGGKNGRIPERGMYRDATTHFTTALEFWAANMYMQDLLLAYDKNRQEEQAEQNEASDFGSGPRYQRNPYGAPVFTP